MGCKTSSAQEESVIPIKLLAEEAKNKRKNYFGLF